jgi:hypothetical protein
MAMNRPAALIGALVLFAGVAPHALAQSQDSDNTDAPRADGTRFHCQDGGEIIAHFETTRARFIAVVDALDGYGPHALDAKPWAGGPVMITWSDGQRTLTWSPGVQIMWMDGSTHRMCGRAGHHH